MKNILRTLLGIQTLKIILVNPLAFEAEEFTELMKGLPVVLAFTTAVKTIQVIETHIPLERSLEE